MAYVERICLAGGETVSDGIKFYLDLKDKQVTNYNTVLILNDLELPIGYYNEDNMDSFRNCMLCIWGASDVVHHGGRKFDDNYLKQSNLLINNVFNTFEDVYVINEVLKDYEKIAKKLELDLFSYDQVKDIRERLHEKTNKILTKSK